MDKFHEKDEWEQKKMSYNIAIDGPAGAGKSTIAKRIAKELSFIYVDTGAMYRAMGLYMHRKDIAGTDIEAIKAELDNVDITISYVNGEQQVFLNGENVTAFLREEQAGLMASAVGTIAEVRAKLVALQQKMAETQDVIMDGRDIGTVVLPKATAKIYLTASSRERARRRFEELKAKDVPCDIDEIEKDIIARDYQDMNRAASPLKQAEDAVLVDCSDMGIEEVVNTIIGIFKEKAEENEKTELG